MGSLVVVDTTFSVIHLRIIYSLPVNPLERPMTIHRIRLLGDPVLRERCEPIAKPRSAAVRVIADDLRETLRDFQERHGFGRGISAPQIGAPVRVVHIEMDDTPWTLVNPEILDIG